MAPILDPLTESIGGSLYFAFRGNFDGNNQPI